MKKVMRGVVKSRRHDLFLDKREREQCSGSETSRLYQLSNPGFLGGGGEKDTAVITHLRDRVFLENFQEANYVIASSRTPERRPLERRTLVPKCPNLIEKSTPVLGYR